jgi:hypothetical protein
MRSSNFAREPPSFAKELSETINIPLPKSRTSAAVLLLLLLLLLLSSSSSSSSWL